MDKTVFWAAHMHACQRDIARLIKEDQEFDVLLSNKADRPDIFLEADISKTEPLFKTNELPAGRQYCNWLLETAKENDVKAIIGMRHATAVVTNSDMFNDEGITVAFGSTDAEKLEICENKVRFSEIMRENGIPVAMSEEVTFGNNVQLCNAYNKIVDAGHTACIKPTYGVYGAGFFVFRDNAPLFGTLMDRNKLEISFLDYMDARKVHYSDNSAIMMEYLPGKEASIDCVCENGEIIAFAVREKHAHFQFIHTNSGPELDIAREVAKLMSLNGLINIQTKNDQNDAPKILEVNTRPSGGVGYSAVAGINLPLICAKVMTGRTYFVPQIKEPAKVAAVTTPVLIG